MTGRLVLRARAEQDLRSAFEWYEAERAGLGGEFLMEVGKRLDEIGQYPEACPVLYREVRRALVARFPYAIFHVVMPNKVVVLAVLRRLNDHRSRLRTRPARNEHRSAP